MRRVTSLSALVLLAVLFPTWTSAAEVLDDAAKLKIFSDACLNRWMQDAPTGQDNMAIKSLGQKFCTCAGKRIIAILENPKSNPTDMEEAKNEASQACLTESILRETIQTPNIKENLSAQKIITSCNNIWSAVFPKGMNESQKAYTGKYCQCASNSLADLISQGDKLTSAQQDEKISSIAATCRKP